MLTNDSETTQEHGGSAGDPAGAALNKQPARFLHQSDLSHHSRRRRPRHSPQSLMADGVMRFISQTDDNW